MATVYYMIRASIKCLFFGRRIMKGHQAMFILAFHVCMVPVYAESSTKINQIVGAIKSTKMFHSKRILLGPLNNDQSNIRESFKFLKAVQALNDGTTLIMGFKNTSKFLSTFNGLVVIPWEIDNPQLCWLATNRFLMDKNSILALVKSADDIRKKLEACPMNIRCMLFPFYQSDDQLSITINEAYKLHQDSDLIIRKMLTFSESKGLSLHTPHISTWERRANLQGIELKGITFEWYPWVIVTKNEASKEIKYGGVSMEILQILQKSLNFTLDVTLTNDWPLVMGSVINKTFEIVIQSVTQTYERSKLDYSLLRLFFAHFTNFENFEASGSLARKKVLQLISCNIVKNPTFLIILPIFH